MRNIEEGRSPGAPEKTREMIVEIGIADGPARVAALKEEIASALGDAFHV